MNKEIYFCLNRHTWENIPVACRYDAMSYAETDKAIKLGCEHIVTMSLAHLSFDLIDLGYNIYLCYDNTTIQLFPHMDTGPGGKDLHKHHNLFKIFHAGALDYLVKYNRFITPKFRVGDTIRHKGSSEVYVIGEVTPEYYTFATSVSDTLKIKDQDDWEIVPIYHNGDILVKKDDPDEIRIMITNVDEEKRVYDFTSIEKYSEGGFFSFNHQADYELARPLPEPDDKIFFDAKFGDMFITFDYHQAVFLTSIDTPNSHVAELYVKGFGKVTYKTNGQPLAKGMRRYTIVDKKH